MARNWDETFKQWADALEQVDEEKGSRASEEVRKAIRNDSALANRRIDVFVTGSYRNTTNTRADSDVDVAVVLRDLFFYELPADGSLTAAMLGLKPADGQFEPFREQVGAALRAAFGAPAVTAGDKAFDVHATSYRLDADVAVFLEHRRYTGKKDGSGQWAYLQGVEMRPRSEPNQSIINWPEQHYRNGLAKNKATNHRFKRIVRIMKRLRADMEAQGDHAARSAAGQARSLLIECLVHSAPDSCFNQEQGGYMKDMASVLSWIVGATRPGADASRLLEVNGIKPLFGGGQRWTQQQAYAFFSPARRYVGVE